MADHHFQPGNPGRPKGAKNKLTVSVRDAVLGAFHNLQEDPKANITAWGKENPTEFYKIAAKLIPTEVNATIKEMPPVFSDDDIPVK